MEKEIILGKNDIEIISVWDKKNFELFVNLLVGMGYRVYDIRVTSYEKKWYQRKSKEHYQAWLKKEVVYNGNS